MTERSIVRTYNPFRYRGYYYDTDTGLYYLQSRYYNPQWGRFLNADGYVNANGDLIGFNMYAYCSNNPVMNVDPSGEGIVVSALIIGAAIGAAIGVISSIASQYIDNGGNWDQINVGMVIYDGLVGAISGAVSATGIGIIGSMAFGAVSGFLSSCFRDLLFESEKSWEDTLVDASWNALFGGVSGLIAGAGANHSTNKIVNHHVLENYKHSRGVLQRTIANGTKHAVNNQFMVTSKYELDFIKGGVRYAAGSLFSFVGSRIER